MRLVDMESPRPSSRVRWDPAGVLLGGDEGWLAVAPAADLRIEGVGAPADLPSGIVWIIDRDYAETSEIRAAHGRRGFRIQSRSWLGVVLDEILRDWGLDRAPLAARADALARLVDRVLRLALETALRLAPERLRGPSLPAILDAAPSLATGLRKVHADLDKTAPDGAHVRDLLVSALHVGAHVAGGPRVESGERLLQFRAPMQSHVRHLCEVRTPGKGAWMRAEMEGDQLSEADLRALAAFDRPVLVQARALPRSPSPPPHLESWIETPGRSVRRAVFTLDEVRVLLPHFVLHDPEAFVGPGWRAPVAARIPPALAETAGDPALAPVSWSLDLVARNLYLSIFRTPKGRDGAPAPTPPETVWLAAAERLRLAAPVARLVEAGARVTGLHAGAITLAVPEDPEVIGLVCAAAWSAGLTAPMAQVRDVAALGAPLLRDAALWGGAPEDLLPAHLRQGARTLGLWRLDALLDLPAPARGEALKTLLGASR